MDGVMACDETWRVLRASLQTLHAIVTTSRGPCGRIKVVRNTEAVMAVSASGATLLSQLPVRQLSVATRLVCDAALAQSDAMGDGSLTMAALACKLVLKCCQLAVPRAAVSHGLALARDWCTHLLQSATCPLVAPMKWSSLDTVTAVAEAVIGSQAGAMLSDTDVDVVSTAMVQALLASVPPSGRDVCDSAPSANVRFMCFVGPPTADTSVQPGAVWLDTTVPPCLTTTGATDVAVALFDASLVPPPSPHVVLETTAGAGAADDDAVAVGAVERATMQRFAEACIRAGVGVVACQRLIHPWLQQYLVDRGVVPLERLSIRHIVAVSRLTGAEVRSSWLTDADAGGINTSALGWLAAIQRLHRLGRDYVVATGASLSQSAPTAARFPATAWPRMQPVVTVLLAAPTATTGTELQQACEASLKVLSRLLLRTPRVVPGGGCVEACLALHVRAEAAKLCSTPDVGASAGASGAGASGAGASGAGTGAGAESSDSGVGASRGGAPSGGASAASASVSGTLRGPAGVPIRRADVAAVCHKAADALVELVAELSGHNGLLASDAGAAVVDAVRVSADGGVQPSARWLGWHAASDDAVPVLVMEPARDVASRVVLSAVVLDSLDVKLQLLHRAFEVAGALLRVEGVVWPKT